ncbi:MAG TPA: histidine kinase [Dehalococcoidia bacterium]|nr:histidine kinase [Dehalococcoidia bacterium]
MKVHEMPSDSPIKTHIVAYTPLSGLPWGVAVEQDRDVALAVASDLQRRFLLFGLLALVGAALLAWVDVRQVVKPLRMLTARASRMAGGDLKTPIGLARRDEVGTLARAFESMRQQLGDSLGEIERRDKELEERVRERTREVERLYVELQAKEDLRSHLLEKLISAQEEERARIARELHDEAGQSLTGIAMSLEAAEASLGPDASTAKERLERAKAVALDTIEEIRKLVVDLRPVALDDLGLVPALRSYAEERLAGRGVRVALEAAERGKRLPPHVESTLFRVVQEAVTNIARHAEAKTARIRLHRDGQRLTLLVEDDGKGFDMAEVLGSPDKTRALGLLGMQERVSLCGGSLRVESAPGSGTRVRAEIPIPKEAVPGGHAQRPSTLASAE